MRAQTTSAGVRVSWQPDNYSDMADLVMAYIAREADTKVTSFNAAAATYNSGSLLVPLVAEGPVNVWVLAYNPFGPETSPAMWLSV